MPKITNGGFNNPCLQEEIQIWKHSPVAAGTEEYFPNHNFFINEYFGKKILGYLTRGSMNKTHILFFQYSLWVDHKIYSNIPIVIVQRKSCSDPAATKFDATTIDFDPVATRIFPI